MSTELFRKYINILNEDSQETVISTGPDIDGFKRLKIALTELESVLGKYQDKIKEDREKQRLSRLLEVELSPEELEALRQASSSASNTAGETGTVSKFLSNNPTIRKTLAKGRGSAIRGGAWGTAAYLAYQALTNLGQFIHWLNSGIQIKDLYPGDQETIRKNSLIIQPWLESDKFNTLDDGMKLRLLHVSNLLEKLGARLKSQSTQQNEEADPETVGPDTADPAQQDTATSPDPEFLRLIDIAYQNIDESSQASMKQFVLNNMHLLSETEQMAVRRAIVTEMDMSWPELAGLVAGPYGIKKAYDWTQQEAGSAEAAEKAEAAAQKEVADRIAAAQAENASIQAENTSIQAENARAQAATDAENIRITNRNNEAERRWRNSGRSGPRPVPETPQTAILKPLKPLVPVPAAPTGRITTLPQKNILQKAGAKVGKVSGAATKLATKYPKTALAVTAVAGIVGWAAHAAYYYTVAKATVDKTMDTAAGAVTGQLKQLEDEAAVFARAAQMTDEDFANLAENAPDELLKYVKIEMRFCSKFPDDPKCKKRREDLCNGPNSDTLRKLNGGPLPGCQNLK